MCCVTKEYFAPFAHIYDPRFSGLIMELAAILKMTKNWPFWKNCTGVFILFKNIDKHVSLQIFGFLVPTNIGIGTKFIFLCNLVPKI